MKYNLNKVQTEYEIEVLNGSIYIDATDIELPKKVQKLFDKADEADKRMKQSKLLLDKKGLNEDKYNDELIEIMIKYVDAVYEGLDELFGEGSHKKIFRVKSIEGLRMFLEGLTEIIKDLGLDAKSYYDKQAEEAKLKGTYAPTEEDNQDIKEL